MIELKVISTNETVFREIYDDRTWGVGDILDEALNRKKWHLKTEWNNW